MRKIWGDGESRPKWYGVAYHELITSTPVCYPFGIHWIVRAWFHLSYIATKPGLSTIEQAVFWEALYYKEKELSIYWETAYQKDVGKLMRVVREEDEDA